MARTRNQHYRLLAICAAAVLLALLANSAQGAPAIDADRFKDTKVTSQPVAGNVHMLTGAGGNIAASIGEDGTLIVDNQFAPLAKRILRAINKIDGDQPKLVVNTHYHFDHTGGNEAFGTAGTIIAHDNVRVRLAGDPDLTRAAMPTVTYDDDLRLHFNGDAIDLIHLPAGHTDGDSVVWFRGANVIHMGDHYFRDTFPFVDLDSGGSVEGYIANLETIVRLVPDDIQVIPGHGTLASLPDLARTLDMMRRTNQIVRKALADGQNADAMVTAGLGAQWSSWGQGFISEERWIRTLIRSAGGVVATP
jgi:glyoxylase-like metal-dependent hydrolase (beta-lactamase superfamily II)